MLVVDVRWGKSFDQEDYEDTSGSRPTTASTQQRVEAGHRQAVLVPLQPRPAAGEAPGRGGAALTTR